MAGSEGQSGSFTSKKAVDDIPVAPCKGWIDPCEFCEKRFCQWVAADDETLEKIPSKPGVLMFALKNKNNTEVVTITVNPINIQNVAFNDVDGLRSQVSDKKSKVTKSSILVRWMVFKKPEDKDVCTLFAHWFNFGVLPKYMRTWPGENYLKEGHQLVFSNQSQKWCYLSKDPVWRKSKTAPIVRAEIIDNCNWFEPCPYCDDYFTQWRPLGEVVDENLAPDEMGICMFSVKYRKKREILYIESDPKTVTKNIKSTVKDRRYWIESQARSDKFFNPGNSSCGEAEVRWLVVSNPNDENSCFLYAHWLNTDTKPMLNSQLPGEKVLERTKQFILRTRDQRWGYEIVSGKPNKFSKIKNKREIVNQIEEEFQVSK